MVKPKIVAQALLGWTYFIRERIDWDWEPERAIDEVTPSSKIIRNSAHLTIVLKVKFILGSVIFVDLGRP